MTPSPPEPTSPVGDGTAMAVASGGSALIGMLSWIAVARLLPPEGIGRAAAFITAFLLIAGLTELNLGIGLLRWLPRAGRDRPKVLVRALGAVTTCAVVGAVLYLAVPGATDVLDVLEGPAGLSSGTAAVVLVAAAAGWAMFQVQDFAIVGLGRAWWAPARTVLFGFGRAAVLIGAGASLTAAAVVWSWLIPLAACVLLSWVATVWWARRAVGEPELPRRVEVLAFLGPTYVGQTGMAVLGQLVPLVVTLRFGPASGAAFFVIWQGITVIDVVSQYFVAPMATAVARDPGRSREHSVAVRRRLLLVLPALAVGAILAQPLLSLFGPHYASHALVLQVMLVGSAARLWVVYRLGEHQAFGRGAAFARLAVLTSATVAGTAALIPTAPSWTTEPLLGVALAFAATQIVCALLTAGGPRTTMPPSASAVRVVTA